jgi:DNA-binding MarR family transcriptional regulator
MERSFSIGREVNHFMNRINRRIGGIVTQYGITGPQAHILNFIFDRSGNAAVMQKDIETEFDIRRSTTTKALQIMESRGLIVRSSVETDARTKKVILTEKGKEIQREVSEVILRSEMALREALTQDEFLALVGIITKLSKIDIGSSGKDEGTQLERGVS